MNKALIHFMKFNAPFYCVLLFVIISLFYEVFVFNCVTHFCGLKETSNSTAGITTLVTQKRKKSFFHFVYIGPYVPLSMHVIIIAIYVH